MYEKHRKSEQSYVNDSDISPGYAKGFDTPLDPISSRLFVIVKDVSARGGARRCCDKAFDARDAKRALYDLQRSFQLPDEVLGAMLFSMSNRVEDTAKLLGATDSDGEFSTEQWCRAQGV